MFRTLVLGVVTLLALFTVLASVVVVGSLRLRADWADAAAAPRAGSNLSPATRPADPPPALAASGLVPAPRGVVPLTLDDEPDPQEPATLYLPASTATLTGAARLQGRRD